MTGNTILVVDDEPTNLAVLTHLLRPHYRVRAVRSGDHALEVASTAPRPDLILLDIMMPGMDGYAVISRLKDLPGCRDIPVIFITALDDIQDEERGLRLGAVDYITKPLRPAIVLARVHAQLELKHARDRLKQQNAWLESEVARRMRENLLIQDASLAAITGLAETRDTETGNHIIRTQAFVEVLGRKLRETTPYDWDLKDPQLERIVKAAPLHDIGKIGIPDRILLKPGKLTPDEFEVMKTHCRIGAEAMAHAIERAMAVYSTEQGTDHPASLAFLETAQVIAISHHEWWNGQGYPNGLRGVAIPLPGRLMALADVYDALTTRRPYKAPWPLEAAAQYVQEHSGTQFDPAVVGAFVAARAAFEDIAHRFADELLAQGARDLAP